MTKDITHSSSSDNSKKMATDPLTREQLYKLVWSEPMVKVAARYKVSSSYMARICTLLKVPRPGRGYWAKIAVGEMPKKPPLPDALPGDELVWSRDGNYNEFGRRGLRAPSKKIIEHSNASVSKTDRHSLINGARQLFESGRYIHKDGYLKPTKRILVDLVVTKPCLNKALSFANELFLSFESKGHRVVIAPASEQFHREDVDQHEIPRKNYSYERLWSPHRCTVVYIGTVAIGLTIIELSEEVEVRYINGKYVREQEYVKSKRRQYDVGHTWTTTKDFPTNRLCLQAYSPYPRARWGKTWRETEGCDLSKQIMAIVKELELSTEKIARLVEKGERQAELERIEWEAKKEQWRREEEERHAAQSLAKSKAELFQIIDGWAEADRIEKYFQAVEQRAAGLSDNERIKISERLQRARELIGSPDAFDHLMKWRAPDEF